MEKEERKRTALLPQKKSIRILFLCLILSMTLFVLSGCGSDHQDNDTKEGEPEQTALQIGMSFDSFVIERWLRDRDLFDATARQLGAEVNVQVANGSCEEQISQIEYFIKKKVDVIVIIACDNSRLSDVIVKAKKEGIRVICYDRLVLDCNCDLYLSFNNEMVGTLMGEAMKTALPEGGNIFMIEGSPVDYNVSMVEKGFQESLEGSGIEIVYSSHCENWLAELAFDAVEKGLKEVNGDVVGVMCGNDDLAGQAFRALAENRLAGKVVLVGQDAELSACQRIVEGTQTMTVYKRVEELAKKSAEYACALGYEKQVKEGKKQAEEIPEELRGLLEEMKDLPRISDGSHEVPFYAIEPIAVTKENMDEVIIGDDFHTMEDVYLFQTETENSEQK